MQYNVIHSKDPYLLARMATDLQMEGNEPAYDWAEDEDFHPFDGNNHYIQSTFLHTGDPHGFEFHNHNRCRMAKPKDRHELTEENYIEVLTEILNQP